MNIILVVDFQLIEWEDESYRDIEVASIPNTALWTFPVLVPFQQIISRKNIINQMINEKQILFNKLSVKKMFEQIKPFSNFVKS